ncbi:MAG: LysM peptidoglycan-binding domain-containing M23 family metallopeptidase [Anaerolineae bacterium]
MLFLTARASADTIGTMIFAQPKQSSSQQHSTSLAARRISLRFLLCTLSIVLLGLFATVTWAAEGDTPDYTPPEEPKVFFPLIARAATQEQIDVVDFTYRLAEGDDLALLAVEWGVDSEAINCVTRSGRESLADLHPGQILMIPDPHYRCHTVQMNETLAQIADDYGVTVPTLLQQPWNMLTASNEPLEPGQRLLIFNGVRPDLAVLRASQTPTTTLTLTTEPTATPLPTPAPQDMAYGDGQFIWPLAGGVLTQGFRTGHRAIDVGAPIGTPVYAADNGVVLKSEYGTDGYGGRVIIDHQNDYVTLYAHLSQSIVQAGDLVREGQIVGYVGSTGNSTGPHLHFEIRDFGYLINPLTMVSAP